MTGRTIQRRFNGATAMEPWKRLRKPYIPRTKSRASMGPRRWSRGRGYASRGCKLEGSGRFNGATAMEPWKRTWIEATRRRYGAASMGPRRWSRGRVNTSGSNLVAIMSFNGATAMEPWKSKQGLSRLGTVERLQWGHGDGAVEENSRPTSAPGSTSRFNGATAMEPWKSRRPAHAGRLAAACFNGATAMEPWKRQGAIDSLWRDIHASMGPRRWSRGRARSSIA